MEIRFKTKEHYDTAYTYLHGNNYMFNKYVDELAIRFFHYLPFRNALEGILEHGLTEDVEYTVHETENSLPALGNAWSAV